MVIYVCTMDESVGSDSSYIGVSNSKSNAERLCRKKFPRLSLCTDAGNQGLEKLSDDDPRGHSRYVYTSGQCGVLVYIYVRNLIPVKTKSGGTYPLIK